MPSTEVHCSSVECMSLVWNSFDFRVQSHQTKMEPSHRTKTTGRHLSISLRPLKLIMKVDKRVRERRLLN